MEMTFRIALCFASLFVPIVGCSQQVGPVGEVIDVVDASGTVTYQGKALEGFTVTFMPVSGERPATGISDAAGHFKLGTNDAGDGAVVGSNKVAVTWAGPAVFDDLSASPIDNPEEMPQPPVEIPASYANPETSGIVIEVPASGADNLKIDLQ